MSTAASMNKLKPPHDLALDAYEERLVYVMQLLGDKTRFKLFKLLIKNNTHGMCVGEIASSLGVSISAVSQHFKNFEQLGLVDKKRTGQKICYELREHDEVINYLKSVIKT
jgi:DNA-binding transcriptional ArsR family regulator